ncbi:hypothetical protein GGI43DRAFT_43559 [Trichoderma evansii]
MNWKRGRSSSGPGDGMRSSQTPCEPYLTELMHIPNGHRLPFRRGSCCAPSNIPSSEPGPDELPDWACTSLPGWSSAWRLSQPLSSWRTLLRGPAPHPWSNIIKSPTLYIVLLTPFTSYIPRNAVGLVLYQ